MADDESQRNAEAEKTRKALEEKSHFIDPTRAISAEEKDYTAGLQNRLNTVQERKAPVVTETKLGAAERFGGAQIAANERAEGANLGSAAQGTAATGTAATIARGEDQQSRIGQVALAAQLQRQANGQGPSLAGGMLRQATDRNIAQQMGVAAAQGGNPAMTGRSAALGAAQMNQQAGRDAAQMRMQEQLSAQQQLAGVLQGTRGQDMSVAQNQAAFGQQMGLANMDASNKFGLANMDARNQFAVEQGRLAQQNAQFNAGMTNTLNQNQAAFGQQAGLANQSAGNNFQLAQAQLDQQTKFANQDAYLKNQGMTDNQIANILGMQEADLTRARQNAQQYDIMKANERVRQGTIAAQQAQAAAQRDAALIGAGGAAVSTLITGLGSGGGGGSGGGNPVSDPAAKTEIRPTIQTSQGGGFDPDTEASATGGKFMAGLMAAGTKAAAAGGAANVKFVDPTASDMTLDTSQKLSKRTPYKDPDLVVSDPTAKSDIQSLAKAIRKGA